MRVLAEKFKWPMARIASAAEYLWPLTRPVSPHGIVTDCADPDDNRVRECALEARAAVIVTGDGHLLKLDPYRKISILRPRQFLDAKPWEDESR